MDSPPPGLLCPARTHLEELGDLFVDFAADGARARLPLVAGVPAGHHVVRVHLVEGHADSVRDLRTEGTIMIVCCTVCAWFRSVKHWHLHLICLPATEQRF